MTVPTPDPAAWQRALDFWGVALQVDPPVFVTKGEALAFIDLTTRRVTVNVKQLEEIGASSCLAAIFTHELGHHFKYPHSLSVMARLQMLEREVLPVKHHSLLNLFLDFLVNNELARDPMLRAQMVRIYTGMKRPPDAVKQDPAFFFFLTCFEEAWPLEPNALTGDAGRQLEKLYPGCRSEAQILAQDLPNLAPNQFTQFLYFASVFSKYMSLDDSGETQDGKVLNPLDGDMSSPSAGDYADAMARSPQEQEAIRRAAQEGWLGKEQIPDAEASPGKRMAGLPGILAGAPKLLAESMAIHYRRLAERHLFRPPPQQLAGDPLIPTTLVDWEQGDAPSRIDWLATLSKTGPDLGLAFPLQRELEADLGSERASASDIRLEIYLDVSGSMPDPKASLNPMTLGAQVLAMSAIRAGGSVRALIYSSNYVRHWEFTRSEMVISRFLMTYIGGGTTYPFDVLQESVKTLGRRQPVRVVLTDQDFHSNLFGYQQKGKALPADAVAAKVAAEKSPFVALLNNGKEGDAWVKAIKGLGLRAIPVGRLEDFPKVAADLATALFP